MPTGLVVAENHRHETQQHRDNRMTTSENENFAIDSVDSPRAAVIAQSEVLKRKKRDLEESLLQRTHALLASSPTRKQPSRVCSNDGATTTAPPILGSNYRNNDDEDDNESSASASSAAVVSIDNESCTLTNYSTSFLISDANDEGDDDDEDDAISDSNSIRAAVAPKASATQQNIDHCLLPQQQQMEHRVHVISHDLSDVSFSCFSETNNQTDTDTITTRGVGDTDWDSSTADSTSIHEHQHRMEHLKRLLQMENRQQRGSHNHLLGPYSTSSVEGDEGDADSSKQSASFDSYHPGKRGERDSRGGGGAEQPLPREILRRPSLSHNHQRLAAASVQGTANRHPTANAQSIVQTKASMVASTSRISSTPSTFVSSNSMANSPSTTTSSTPLTPRAMLSRDVSIRTLKMILKEYYANLHSNNLSENNSLASSSVSQKYQRSTPNRIKSVMSRLLQTPPVQPAPSPTSATPFSASSGDSSTNHNSTGAASTSCAMNKSLRSTATSTTGCQQADYRDLELAIHQALNKARAVHQNQQEDISSTDEHDDDDDNVSDNPAENEKKKTRMSRHQRSNSKRLSSGALITDQTTLTPNSTDANSPTTDSNNRSKWRWSILYGLTLFMLLLVVILVVALAALTSLLLVGGNSSSGNANTNLQGPTLGTASSNSSSDNTKNNTNSSYGHNLHNFRTNQPSYISSSAPSTLHQHLMSPSPVKRAAPVPSPVKRRQPSPTVPTNRIPTTPAFNRTKRSVSPSSSPSVADLSPFPSASAAPTNDPDSVRTLSSPTPSPVGTAATTGAAGTTTTSATAVPSSTVTAVVEWINPSDGSNNNGFAN